MTDTPNRVRVIYAKQIVHKGKAYALFVPVGLASKVTDHQSLVHHSGFFRPGKTKLLPGGIYEANGTLNDGGMLMTLGHVFTFIGASDHPLTAAWQMDDRALTAKAAGERLEKKLLADPVAMREIKRLQDIFNQCDYETRGQFVNVLGTMLWRRSLQV